MPTRSSIMGELENLRKRAKHLVRQHRAGVYTVAARLRLSLPRFAGLTDREVLAAEFALHEAQEVVASELGFTSWSDLKEHPPMPVTDTSAPRLQRANAQVFVTDFPRAMTFYRTLLGFEIAFTYGEPPFYGELRRGDACFNVRHVDKSPFVADVREQEQLLSAYVATTNAKDLFLEFQAAGVDFQERLQLKPWGANEFVVRDPDGNLILFGTPSAQPSRR
ncbi:VOC family protein [Occultella gossypii]|uniref:VOC family protein n=1 Tax=Occultella gossypii TaxID=2800820 RepID=A0ABS7S9G8_9MICO|nr:VOC family protein [Occultella gossypii]MBZ2196573.1 VOC family protein [Occultella gossypii]